MLLVNRLHTVLVVILAASLVLTGQAASASGQQPIKLQAMSDQGTFRLEIMWTPNRIGDDNTFEIRFIEPETNTELEDIKYDISIVKGEQREIHRADQIATQQDFKFGEPGSYAIKIEDIEGLGEGVTIPIQVTPEFPLGSLMLAVTIVGAVIFVARRNSNNLFR
jgi:hypothetical protein